MVFAKKKIAGYQGTQYYFDTQVAFDSQFSGCEDPHFDAERMLAMLEVGRQNGNKDLPVRFHLDREAYEHVRDALNRHLESMERWKDLSLMEVKKVDAAS